MCGILAILDHQRPTPEARALAVQQARLLRHRGPDWSGVWTTETAVLAHERLGIVDPARGAQPIVSADGTLALAVNGEIYDHQAHRAACPYPWSSASDCEVILPLYRRHGVHLLAQLRGMFAFVLYDTQRRDWLIARDPMGVIPLYTGRDAAGALWVASEMKALMGVCVSVDVFPPGHVQTSADAAPRRWSRWDWATFDEVDQQAPADPAALQAALVDSVRSHLMSDVPYGVLLSGGLDSSVVAAIAAKLAPKRVEDDGAAEAWWPRLHSFSIGLAGSPDLAAAQVAADALGTVHHGFEYTFEEGFDAIRDVIWHLETFDTTTIRASTPMYLLARRIKAMGVKMVLSGEGADEIFGGYLYFHRAPDAREFHEETVRKLEGLHAYDCLRANKAMAAFGVEARVPFLDQRFMQHAMHIPARHKMGGDRIEKHLLRTAFEGWLPEEILWRQKEQFSDGVGYGWIDGLKAHAEVVVSDAQMLDAGARFPVGTPLSKEQYVYRAIFESLFELDSAAATVPVEKSIACSTPTALRWDAAFEGRADPSGRAVMGHERAY
jgi:asparagine synthase (glutamine-hydrolysing)